MKSLVYIALVLGGLMVTASLDAVPDPPAVNPHMVYASVSGTRLLPDVFDGQPRCPSLCLNFYPSFQRFELADPVQPQRPSDVMASTGYTGDSSPPVFC